MTDDLPPDDSRTAEDCVEDACRWIEARVLDDGDGVVVLADVADAARAPAPSRCAARSCAASASRRASTPTPCAASASATSCAAAPT